MREAEDDNQVWELFPQISDHIHDASNFTSLYDEASLPYVSLISSKLLCGVHRFEYKNGITMQQASFHT